MFHVPFWILMAIFAFIALMSIKRKGFSFVDYQVMMAVVAVSLMLDMIFCKWFNAYAYVVNEPLRAYYSLIFCLIGYPAIGLFFLKFLPKSKKWIPYYIIASSIGLTLIELLVEPFGIVLYSTWDIIPHSPVIYLLCYTAEYYYYEKMCKRTNHSVQL